MITYFTPVSIVVVTVNLIHNGHHLSPYLERWLPYTHHFLQDQCDWDQEVAAFITVATVDKRAGRCKMHAVAYKLHTVGL